MKNISSNEEGRFARKEGRQMGIANNPKRHDQIFEVKRSGM